MSALYHTEDGFTLYHGDCNDVMREMEPDSVDAIITDPPYNGVKSEAWDNQWGSDDEYLQWLDAILEQYQRLLRFNGSLYVFASPQMAARVEVLVGTRFNVLNAITWIKSDGWHKKAKQDDLRSYFPQTERIIFAEHYNSDNAAKGEAGYATKCDELRGFVFEPLRAYLASEWMRAGLKYEQANEACGTASMAGRHYFSRSQWCLPTSEHYTRLQRYANANGGDYLRREYEDLRREYEDLRREYEDLRREYEDLRRPFFATPDVPYTDVWDFDTVASYKGKHPCEKPVALLEHIIRTSTRPGAVVLDSFVGSGATGAAARALGRKFVGIEQDEHWCEYAAKRIERELLQPRLFQPDGETPIDRVQGSLF